MKKVVITIIVFFIAGLSFLAGGRYWREQPTSAKPKGVIREHTELHQEDFETSSIPGAVKISPSRQQLVGVKVAVIEKQPLTHALRLYGKVVPDETRLYRVNASTDCWIRQLSQVTTGSVVNKNTVLAEALAPSYYNAQLTYVLALDNIDRIRKQLGGEVRHQQADLADNQIRMAVQGMQNLGITDAQIEELAKTRKAKPYLEIRSPAKGVVLSRNLTLNQWFKAGEEFYRIADIRKVWVYADVYENEISLIRPGMAVLLKHGHLGKSFSARVGQVLPLFDQASRTLKVRLDVDNPRYELRPDMFVDVEIPVTLPPTLSVPAGAVLDSGTRAIVYVEKGNGIFEPRRVKTGWSFGGQVEIIEGLKAGEKIVVSGNFLIDSESRMERAASGVEPERRSAPTPVRDLKKDKGALGTAEIKERPPGSDTTSVPVKTNKVAPDMGLQPPGAGSGKKEGAGQTREGSYPFPGAQYLGTVSRDPAPAEGEPIEDKLRPRQFEIPAAPPSGTRLK